MKASAGRVLMFVENKYPSDIRVRNEATTLVSAGYQVSVIALRGRNEAFSEVVNGVSVYRVPQITLFSKTKRKDPTLIERMVSVLQSVLGYLVEYAYFTLASFMVSLSLLVRRGFDAVHFHNPPDTLFVIGAFYKMLGKKMIFDHHDLSPELYLSRYGLTTRTGPIYRTLAVFEKCNLKLADVVIATNESYRAIDIRRGGIDPGKVFIVRNGPNLDRIKEVAPDRTLKAMGKTILVYIGVMGPQDGVDYLLRAMRHLVYDLKRTDVYCVLIGKGDSLDDLKQLAHGLNIEEHVWFTGFIPEEDLVRYLATADICVDPDPSSPLNDVSTWIKIMEYMAMGKPIVTFDLKETRYSAQEAAEYVQPNDEMAFAKALVKLMDDPELRSRMGAYGKRRIETELKWDIVRDNLLSAYRSIF